MIVFDEINLNENELRNELRKQEWGYEKKRLLTFDLGRE